MKLSNPFRVDPNDYEPVDEPTWIKLLQLAIILAYFMAVICISGGFA